MIAPISIPPWLQRRLPTGLTVAAAQRNSTPLAEIRMSIPFARTPPAESVLLANTLLAGTRLDWAVAVDMDFLRIGGHALAEDLPEFLRDLACGLTGYSADELVAGRSRAAEVSRIETAQPAVLVLQALNNRLYGDHPYGLPMPSPDQLAGVPAEALRSLHARRVRPSGATLLLAGQPDPAAAVEIAGEALAGWQGEAPEVDLRPVPEPRPGPLELVDGPGPSSLIRIALPAPLRTDAAYPALVLANLVFGGYFCARLTENLRERNEFCYAPSSSLVSVRSAGLVLVSADVPAEVTGAALREIECELAGLAKLDAEELDRARHYARGRLRMRASTQAGLVDLMADLAAHDLGLDWLAGYDGRLASTSLDAVREAAARYFAPERSVGVVLGDADAVTEQLGES